MIILQTLLVMVVIAILASTFIVEFAMSKNEWTWKTVRDDVENRRWMTPLYLWCKILVWGIPTAAFIYLSYSIARMIFRG
jgi:hypothetical protein